MSKETCDGDSDGDVVGLTVNASSPLRGATVWWCSVYGSVCSSFVLLCIVLGIFVISKRGFVRK